MALGTKLSKSVSRIGQKIQKGSSQLGQKISGLERQAQRGIEKGIQMGQGAVRDVERGIEGASGKIGSVKQGFIKGARVLDALQATGVAGMVPGLGSGLAAASGALRGGAAGLKQLQDVGRDTRMATGKVKNQLSSVGQKASEKVGDVGGMARSKVEKFGERAKALEQQTQEDISNVTAAFK
jgi:hypothetical protein